MKSLEFAFEINWPLEAVVVPENHSFQKLIPSKKDQTCRNLFEIKAAIENESRQKWKETHHRALLKSLYHVATFQEIKDKSLIYIGTYIIHTRCLVGSTNQADSSGF